MSDSPAPLNRIDDAGQPMQAEHVTCEHWWVATIQSDFPDEVRSISRCGLCGYYNGADLSEQVVAALAAARAQVEAVRAAAADWSAHCTCECDDCDRFIDALRVALGTAHQPRRLTDDEAAAADAMTKAHLERVRAEQMADPEAADQPPKGASE